MSLQSSYLVNNILIGITQFSYDINIIILIVGFVITIVIILHLIIAIMITVVIFLVFLCFFRHSLSDRVLPAQQADCRGHSTIAVLF